MKIKLCVVTILAFMVSYNGVAQDQKKIRAKLNAATVFFQGAELTHTVSDLLTKGDNEVSIEGLSPNIDLNSLKIKASNGAVVTAYEFSTDYLALKSGNLVEKKLKDSIAIYEKKLEVVNTNITVTNNLANLLQKGIDKNVSNSENGLGIDELIKTMEYYKTKSAELQTSQSAYNKEKVECTATLDRLKKQLTQESVKNNKTSGVLKLSLMSPIAGSCNFTVSYFTSAANWAPYYDINILATDKPIRITSKSKVRQTTGLDWANIKLTLSTAMPSNGKVAPLFSAWFLAPQSYALSGKNRSAGKMMKSMVQNSYAYDAVIAESKIAESSEFISEPLYIVDGNVVDANYVASLDQQMIKDRQVVNTDIATELYGASASAGAIIITLKSGMDDYVSVADNELNTTYNIDVLCNIPGNGKLQSIDLQTKEVIAEYKYYCAPKLDSETYLLAEIADWEKLNLLSGKANITYDGTYVGETTIDAGSTHKKLTLTLGTDKRVSVKREKMKDFKGSQFLGNDVKQLFTYRITVKNNQTKPIKLVVKDQYPISTQKNIEVELLKKDVTPWTAHIESMGVITWEEEFKAGESKVYQISYTVKYPKGTVLNL